MDTTSSVLFEREFFPSRSKAPLILLLVCCVMIAGALAIPFLGEMNVPQDFLIVAAVFLVFGFVAKLALNGMRSAKTTYICSKDGITRRYSSEELFIQWSDVLDIECAGSLGGNGELRVRLLGARGVKLLTIETEYLRRGGRDMIEALQYHLKPLFDKKAAAIQSGEIHTTFSIIEDVLKEDGDNLVVEFPKNKKRIIPFEELNRVEWLPGCISGTSAGRLIIDHSGGRIKLIQGIKGLHYFLHLLKNIRGLHCVNPARTSENTERLDSLRRKAGVKRMCLIAGVLLFFGTMIPVGIIVWDHIKKRQTERIGKTTQAVVAEKSKNDEIVLKYVDPNGVKRDEKVRVLEEFYAGVKVGDNITIKVHPVIGDELAFEGKWSLAWSEELWLIAHCVSLSLFGLALLVYSLWNSRARKKEIAELDADPIIPAVVATDSSHPSAEADGRDEPLASSHPSFLEATSANGAEMTSSAPEGELKNGGLPEAGESSDTSIESDVPPLLSDVSDQAVPPLKTESFEKEPVTSFPVPAGRVDRCDHCGEAIEKEYFLSSGESWCGKCKENWLSVGQKAGCMTFMRIVAYGFGAAAFGGGLWALIVIATGYELGLIAVVVGLLVGHAVKMGAKGYRGRLCQVMALILTFIGLSYSTVPIMVNEFRKNPEYLERFKKKFEEGRNAGTPKKIEKNEKTGAATGVPKKTGVADDVPKKSVDEKVDATSGKNLSESSEKSDAVKTFPQNQAPPKRSIFKMLLQLLLGILLIVLGMALLIVAPVLIYVFYLFSSPFSAIFTAIALWEAWRINKIEERQFQGPFEIEDEIDLEKAEFDLFCEK